MEITKSQLRKNPATLTRVIDSNAVVIFLSDNYDDSLKKEVYIFNDTATEIWNLIDGRKSIRQIARAILPGYDSPPKKIQESVVKFVDKLMENRLIEAGKPN